MLESNARKNGHSSLIRRSSASRAFSSFSMNCAIAEPKPCHPGNATRACAHEKLHGIARRSSIRRDGLREAGREPILSEAISEIGVDEKKKSTKPSVP